MPYNFIDGVAGMTPIGVIDASPNVVHPVGTIRGGVGVGNSPVPDGGVEYIYLQGVASLVAGDIVSYNANGAVTRWAGTNNSNLPLAVAIATPPLAGQFGWFQVQGIAIVNTSGTVAAGNSLFWQATATASATGVASKQITGAVATSANGVPSANKSLVSINRPVAQGAIT